MSVKIVSFSSSGGAGAVARTLDQGFAKIGISSSLLTATATNLRDQPSLNPMLTAAAVIDDMVYRSPNWKSLVSVSRDKLSVILEDLTDSDLVIFRWMNGILGHKFLSLNSAIPNLVWGLDDMNPFTGVCHYSGECRGYESGCTRCPALRTIFGNSAAKNLQKKIELVHRYNPYFVAPTDWILKEFNKSRLAPTSKVTKVYNPLPDAFFTSAKKEAKFGRKVGILIVAANLDDPTKGVDSVKAVLNSFLDSENFALTMVGRASLKLRKSMPSATFLGPLGSTELRQQMGTHDLLLVPSLFENAGTVVAEAASQGLPSMARAVGGMEEMTNFGDIGYLFKTKEDLHALLDSIPVKEIARRGNLAKEWAQQFRSEKIALRYAELFLASR